jgi:hypothetical protein
MDFQDHAARRTGSSTAKTGHQNRQVTTRRLAPSRTRPPQDAYRLVKPHQCGTGPLGPAVMSSASYGPGHDLRSELQQ